MPKVSAPRPGFADQLRLAGRVVAVLLILAGAVVLALPSLQRAVADQYQQQEAQAYTAEAPSPPPMLIDVFERFGGLAYYQDPVVDSASTQVEPWTLPATHASTQNPAEDSPPDSPLPVQTRVWDAEHFPGAKISIPRINLQAHVVFGTDTSQLARGPAFYEQGAPPDHPGNTAIAGHRSTYGAWFAKLDQLQVGDAIHVEYDGYDYVYLVTRSWVVDPYDWSVVDPTETKSLTLTTCHPYGSDRERLIVRGELDKVIPLI